MRAYGQEWSCRESSKQGADIELGAPTRKHRAFKSWFAKGRKTTNAALSCATMRNVTRTRHRRLLSYLGGKGSTDENQKPHESNKDK